MDLIRESRDFEQSLRELEEQKERYRLVLDGTKLGLWDWNPQTNELHFDEKWAKIIGYQLSEIEHTFETWYSRLHPDDIENTFRDIQAHVQGKTDFYHNIHRMKHKDGHWVHILARGRIYAWSPGGEPIRFTGSHEDISEKVLLEQQLELQKVKAMESEKFVALAQMGGGIAHEINNPLSIALGYLQILKRDLREVTTPGIEEKLNKITSALNRVTQTVSSLLILSRDEKNEESSTITVSEIVSYINNITSERFKSLGCELIIDIKTDFRVHVNRLHVAQVILILVSNAFDAIEQHKNKWIKITVAPESERDISVCVVDSGSGIKDSVVKNMFNPFYTTKPVGKGTGLGLSLARNMIEANGGTLQYVPDQPHTKFCISLPRA